MLNGGAYDDTFFFGTGYGRDVVTDFSVTGGDILQLSLGAAVDTFEEAIAHARQVGANTVFDFGNGDALTLQNVQLAQFTTGEFSFGAATI